MHSRHATVISAIALLFAQGQLSGWGSKRDPHFPAEPLKVKPTATELHFPLSDHQEWFLKESYLYWVPFEDDVDYGVKVRFDSSTPAYKTEMKKPNYDWSSGVRVGGGLYIPDHEFWDISAYFTYYHNLTESHSSARLANDETLNSTWVASIFGEMSKSKVSSLMNLYMGDLTAGRNYSLTSWLDIHPFIGVRGAFLYQDYKNRNSSIFPSTDSSVPDGAARTSFKAEQNFYGVGPRIGTDLNFSLGKGWSFLGNLSVSLLWSHYAIKQKTAGNLFARDGQFPTLSSIEIKAKDAAQSLNTNLEGSFGLGWEKWNGRRSVRFAPSLLFEVSEWFSINHWFDETLAGVPSELDPFVGVKSRRHNSDLGFLGLTVNLQVDY